MIQWWNFLIAEILLIVFIVLALGYVKLPRFMRRRQLVRGLPWGYYPDAVPKNEFFAENNTDFMHDVGTEFVGAEGFGDHGEFTGFGELGEFGQNFSYTADSGGGH